MKGFIGRAVVPGAVAFALVSGLAGGAATPLVSTAVASAEPYTFPQETRLVKFRYDENRTYEILARPNSPTNIALAPDEELVALAIGDTVQWITDDIPGHIFVKPVRPGVYTAGTIVTDKRTYQISLRAVPSSGQWYQRVSWEHGSGGLIREANRSGRQGEGRSSSSRQAAEATAAREHAETSARGTRTPHPSELNFGYQINGASGVVQSAFDDGKSLWIRLEDDLDELPAVFVEGRNSSQALANYRVDGNYIVVHQVSRVTRLRIGRDEVVIERG